jgi:hypothetical protein
MLLSRLYVAFSFGSSKPKCAAETVDERAITTVPIEGLKCAYFSKGFVSKTVQSTQVNYIRKLLRYCVGKPVTLIII